MTAITSVRFKEEIEHNLSIMNKTLSEGRAVDQGFIDIFKKDIADLTELQTKEKIDTATSAPVITQLTKSINESADKLKSIVKGIFKITSEPTGLVAAGLQNAGEIAKRYTAENEAHIKAGFEALNQGGISVRKVAGDGHCMFRAMIAKILIDNQRQKKNTKSKILTLAERAAKSKTYSDETKEIAKKVINSLNPKKNQSALEILQNPEQSNLLVHFLRLIAVDGLRNNKGATFRETFDQMLQNDEMTAEDYYADMSSMAKATYGNQPEINELEKALKMKFEILGLGSLGRKTATLPPKKDLTPGKIFLLHNPTSPAHYDLAEVPMA